MTIVTIRPVDEINRALRPYVPLVAQLTGKDVTLERIRPLMMLLGNPQERLRVVHIAGTSGKTSTAYYMAALLSAAGKKVGLTVSPHIDKVTERVQIDGLPLADDVFGAFLGEFLKIIKRIEQPPSYFELLYAFAMWVFDRQQVDYAVVETGMGGLYDATNVISRADKLCVITDIGLDHTHILGNTLAEIAAQKVGIVQPGNHLFMYQQGEEIMEVIQQEIVAKQASLHLADSREVLEDQMPDFQKRNWNLAHYVYSYLVERDGLPQLEGDRLVSTRHLQVPGRMEIRHIGDKVLIMDGAHNAQKMASFVASFQKLYPEHKPAILIGLKQGKEYADEVEQLVPVASRVITTAFQTTQDLPVKSIDPEKLAQAFSSTGLPTLCIEDQSEAIKNLLGGPESLCVITGSFYLLSQIRNNEGLS